MAVDLSGASLITTEEVLGEFLTAVSAQAERTRRLACPADRILSSVFTLEPGEHDLDRHAGGW